jgi:ABC-type uncharacterized transport system auxiliary subunit
MQTVFLIFIVTIIGCTNVFKNKFHLKNNIWLSQDMKFDTTYADGDSSLYSIYGSGKLLLLDTNYIVKTFTNTFINNYDSIAWGEPGIILLMEVGNW